MLIICRKCSYFQANDQIKRGLFNGDIFLFVNFPVFQTHAQQKNGSDATRTTATRKSDNDYSYRKFMGKCAFAFYYNPTRDEDGKIINAGWNFSQFGYGWNANSENYLKNDPTYGCYASSSWHGNCTALIQYNNC